MKFRQNTSAITKRLTAIAIICLAAVLAMPAAAQRRKAAKPKAKRASKPGRTDNRRQLKRAIQRHNETGEWADTVCVDDEEDYSKPQKPRKMRTVRDKNSL